MGVGDGEQPPGTVQVLSAMVAVVPSGGGVNEFVRVRAGRRHPVVTRLWPRLAGCVSGSMLGSAAAVTARLEASVSTTSALWLESPRVAAASSSTSTDLTTGGPLK